MRVSPWIPALGVAAAITGSWLPAFAEDIPAGSEVTLGGDQTDDEYNIAGTVRVPAYNASTPGQTGFLHLRANRITISATGIIDATGRGYAFAPGAGGPGAGGTPADIDGANEPGGGASHSGLGGTGANTAGCAPFGPASAGLLYDDDPFLAPAALGTPADGLGSAGGGSNTANNPAQQPGGPGGGVIILEAPIITIDGLVQADGVTPSPILGTSAGGGSGGSVVIRSVLLTLGTTAMISARGAAGAEGNANTGGGGGGGRVFLNVLPNDPMLLTKVSVDGGGPPAGCFGSLGLVGIEEVEPPTSCPDIDGDGHASDLCPAVLGAGDDCNDVVASVSPDANEACNGRDDNCNGDTDEQLDGAPRLCPEGSACQAGVCAPITDGGPPPADGGATEAPELALSGGLCSSSTPGGVSGAAGPLFGGLSLAAAFALARRRRRRR